MTICPYCQSNRVITKNAAKKTGGFLGMVGGFFGALVGATAGVVAGSKLGETIDERVLDNYHCLDCNYEFSQQNTD